MAIKKEVTSRFGNVLPNAYLKISSFGGDKDNISYVVRVWVNAAARNDNKPHIESYDFRTPTPLAGALLPALYTHLKTLDLASGGEDV